MIKMAKIELIAKMVDVADELDEKGLVKDASVIDSIITKVANDTTDAINETGDYSQDSLYQRNQPLSFEQKVAIAKANKKNVLALLRKSGLSIMQQSALIDWANREANRWTNLYGSITNPLTHITVDDYFKKLKKSDQLDS